MVVQHNMQAANANRMLNVTPSAQSKSTEKPVSYTHLDVYKRQVKKLESGRYEVRYATALTELDG